MLPKVSIIVVGTNEKSWLYASLSTLLESDYQNFSLIYVDNASKDGSVAFVKSKFPNIHVILNEYNMGFSGANNVGIEYALNNNSDYVFLVNPDTITPKKLVGELVNFMVINESYGCIGPMQLEYNGDHKFDSAKFNEWSRQAIINGDRHEFYHDYPNKLRKKSVDQGKTCPKNTLEHAYVQGAALFLRISALKKTGLFDMNYHTFYEELDLCRRFKWNNYKVALITDLYIQHKGGGGTNNTVYKSYLMLRNKYYYLLTDPEWKYNETLILISRWLRKDICSNYKNIFLLLKSFYWVIINANDIVNIRNKNKSMFHRY